MCMSIYACKCGVPKKILIRDMNAIFDKIAGIEHVNPLTKEDMKSALEAYDKEYYDTSIKEIEYWTDVRIERNKRNRRKQSVHLMGARAIQQINDEANGTDWRMGNGRKPKESIVYKWRLDHPDGRKADCIRDTGLDKKTVYKWWNSLDVEAYKEQLKTIKMVADDNDLEIPIYTSIEDLVAAIVSDNKKE